MSTPKVVALSQQGWARSTAVRATWELPIRILLLVATGVLLVIAAWEVVLWIPVMGPAVGWGPASDFGFYRSVGEKWLETGQYYTPDQLSGPYVIKDDVHVLYPPLALYLFVPFALGVPGVLWFAIPAAIMVYALNRWRPAKWTWPLLAFAVFWHNDINDALQGANIWNAAAVAGALLWGFPAMLALLKPTWLPFIVLGIWKRGWWIGLAGVIALSLPMLPLWFDYVSAVGNMSYVPFMWSWGSWPMLAAPFVAWLGRKPQPRQPLDPMPRSFPSVGPSPGQ